MEGFERHKFSSGLNMGPHESECGRWGGETAGMKKEKKKPNKKEFGKVPWNEDGPNPATNWMSKHNLIDVNGGFAIGLREGKIWSSACAELQVCQGSSRSQRD